MPADRRAFIARVAGGAAAGFLTTTASAHAGAAPRFKALAFDAFTTFDPRPIAALAEQVFPGNGAELSNLWPARQFEYTWLRTLSRRYTDFSKVTEDALRLCRQIAEA